jgi:predicted nucleotidyltransferase
MKATSLSIQQNSRNLIFHGLEIPKEKIVVFCRRWEITELSLFGSILRDDFRPDSDIDVLVTFAAGAKWTIDDLLQMKEALEALLGHPVDLVEKDLVETSENYIRRKHILNHKEILYVA